MRYFRSARPFPGRGPSSVNPYLTAAELAARRPRIVLAVVGSILAMIAIMGLIVLSSAQAFLAVSQGSTNRSRLSLGTGDGVSVAPAAIGTAVATGAFVPAAAGGTPAGPVPRDQTVSIYGIRVHASIAGNFRALMDAARADGIDLSGWGWRDHQTQIRLRRKHCGTSHYAIYDMPSSRCSPPTARPGRSQHELGLAIDFTYNGRSISTRRNTGFRWLDANAGKFGFKNLASEPWHWSTTGR